MIWYWLMIATRKLHQLFVLPRPSDVKKLEPNAKCNACGASDGRLRCVHAPVGVNKAMRVLVQHTCNVCGARSYEKPIVDVSIETAYAAIARDELEKTEDFMKMVNKQRPN